MRTAQNPGGGGGGGGAMRDLTVLRTVLDCLQSEKEPLSKH